MLAPQVVDELLERLQELTNRGVGEAVDALQSEQLAIAPWPNFETAIKETTIQAVAFANHRGGDLVLGIEPDGTVRGCDGLDEVRLTHEVFARTRPGIIVECRRHDTQGAPLAIVSVIEDSNIHATAEGLRVRRVGRSNLPITPDQDSALRGDRVKDDFTDRAFPGLTLADLDPLQVIYLREILRRKNDQSELLELNDEELLMSLGLLDEHRVPRVATVLLLGSRQVMRDRLPQTEVVYIHLNEQEEPDVQEQLYLPLLHTLSRLQDLIEARNRFTTLRQGLFHFKVKDFDEEVYREALVNALVHRDYRHRDGSIHILHTSERLEISNPGGLIGGVAVDNILYHPPRHRNRRLTEVLQQLGLMERAGAGVNRLYRHLLRKGKPIPDYEVTSESVRLTIHAGNIDETFAQFVHEEEARGRLFGLDMLILLSSLKRVKALDRATAARYAQRPERSMSNTLNKMVERGYLERVGTGRSTSYRLSSRTYEKLGSKVAYFRDRGLSQRRQRALVLEVAEELGGMSNADCQELCGVPQREAGRLLKSLVQEGVLTFQDGKYRPG